ncbi:hypothetical protein BD311DRAFT_743475 [Dichomitus squalens]|uniref:Uncharacterized protein n=1 Tax=Dichomitus squalens TaxID=114155 RepID=A0A4Q9M4C1_9APHY|nr:hypothetical protein BD311DRAFT_743475 [Dichomitus squalens]
MLMLRSAAQAERRGLPTSLPLPPLRTSGRTYSNCCARLRELGSESETWSDSHLVQGLSALFPLRLWYLSPQVSASLPASKSKHIRIQARAPCTYASSSRFTASAAVVQNHWQQVADCVGFSKRLQLNTEKSPDWEAIVPLLHVGLRATSLSSGVSLLLGRSTVASREVGPAERAVAAS